MQRRQLGAITIARLLASILVTWTTSVRAKICNTMTQYIHIVTAEFVVDLGKGLCRKKPLAVSSDRCIPVKNTMA